MSDMADQKNTGYCSAKCSDVIVHAAGCGWETGPVCTCGADPERGE